MASSHRLLHIDKGSGVEGRVMDSTDKHLCLEEVEWTRQRGDQ